MEQALHTRAAIRSSSFLCSPSSLLVSSMKRFFTANPAPEPDL